MTLEKITEMWNKALGIGTMVCLTSYEVGTENKTYEGEVEERIIVQCEAAGGKVEIHIWEDQALHNSLSGKAVFEAIVATMLLLELRKKERWTRLRER